MAKCSLWLNNATSLLIKYIVKQMLHNSPRRCIVCAFLDVATEKKDSTENPRMS